MTISTDALENMHWRVGVLDHDLINDPQAIGYNAEAIASWYVENVSTLLEELQNRGSDGGL